MFRKPYRVKTSTTMKGSDRRALRNLIETNFPSLPSEDISNLVPNKSEMNQVKAMTFGGRTLMIFCFKSEPVFFQIETTLYPSLYTVWDYVDLLPVITTVPPVLEKICNGADLMAPGVVINETTVKEMKNLKANDICAVRIIGNKAPIAIGRAIISMDELCSEGIKGKAVSIVHNYKDHLWSSGSSKELPIIAELQPEICQDFENMNMMCDTTLEEEKVEIEDKDQLENKIIPDDGESDNIGESIPNFSMDEILYHSFMAAIKVHGKKVQLPLLTSTFYSSYVLKSCPPELNLDIKKTTHKKLSVFLKKMSKEKIVQIKELTKGVESIVAINLENEAVKSYRLEILFKNHLDGLKHDKPKEEDPSANIQENYKFPTVVELYVISAQVKKLFEAADVKKGDSIPASKVRDVLKLYVKNNSLQCEKNPREIILDPLLADCVLKRGDNRSTMSWEDAYEAIVHNMPHAFQITYDGKDPILKKGKLEPIKITVDTRTGNKKVTLIHNLETYGINPEKVAHHAQVAVAASTSITATQNGKGTIVLIQGNQVLYLQKLFLDTLKVPRKFIQGLENVPGKKK